MIRDNTVLVPYAQALALTLAVEVPVYAVALRWAGLLPWGRALAVAVGANLVTHPLVWLILTHHTGAAAFAVVEVAAWLVESALILLLVRRDAALICLVALVANLTSVLLSSYL
jgi:hypothetical protein